jgi:hypothetical protein
MEIPTKMNDINTNNAIERYLKLFEKRRVDITKLGFIEKKLVQ